MQISLAHLYKYNPSLPLDLMNCVIVNFTVYFTKIGNLSSFNRLMCRLNIFNYIYPFPYFLFYRLKADTKLINTPQFVGWLVHLPMYMLTHIKITIQSTANKTVIAAHIKIHCNPRCIHQLPNFRCVMTFRHFRSEYHNTNNI